VPVIELNEEEPRFVPAGTLAESQALELHRNYGKQIEVSFPGPVLGSHYRLRPHGYVGWFPLNGGLQVHVRPKVPVRNLFGMLEWAYRFQGLCLWDEGIRTETVGDLFEFLAATLSRRIIDRVHQGLWRDFEEREDILPCVRGRVLATPTNRVDRPILRCRFAEQTADLADNRILAWTLFALRRYPFQRDQVRRLVHRAFFLLAGAVDPVPVLPEDCAGRTYHRLNQDYRLLHALCRLFLEQSGPAVGPGNREFMGFAVHMPSLFETFVGEWLKAHLRPEWEIDVQRRVPLEGSERLAFQIDLTLRERDSGKHLAVLDTKYKREQRPEEGDIQQVVAYAVRMGAEKAYLIYPHSGIRPSILSVGSVKVGMHAFDLGLDLEQAGRKLAGTLGVGKERINGT
jgi:5-methylcytosine-specific restriction enzyme subunit McrC